MRLISLDVWHVEIALILGKPEADKVAKDYDFEPLDERSRGHFWCSENGNRFVVFGEKPTPGFIAHECLHVVTDIFNDNGIPITHENDEAMAYTLGCLVDLVTTEVGKKWPGQTKGRD